MEQQLELLERLKRQNIAAFKDLISLSSESLTDWATVRLKDAKKARHAVDEILLDWFNAKFEGATEPLDEWMIRELGKKCEKLV
jgi:hypothetical protein